MSDLEDLIQELENASRRLRSGELDADGAAELVERCAALAARIGGALEEAGRAAERAEPAEGQEQLL